jgi:tetratricopeptide (TPR) repeat protein
MRMRYSALALLAVLPFVAGCAKVQAKMDFKDGNKAYQAENFKQAIVDYTSAVEKQPDFTEAWFYLGSSHQALYRPGKDDPANKANLDKAIEFYKKSLDTNLNQTPNQKIVRSNTLAALTGIYGDDPYRNFDEALKYAQMLVQDNPNDPKNLYAMANLYEKFGKVSEAETTYKQVADANPNDTKACGALAAFYNKPLWDGLSKFEQAIHILERCATLDPKDPSGWQKVAVFYWDKAYRDPLLNDQQKNEYADKGLTAADEALKVKPDYFEAIIFKGLLYRVKANVAGDPRMRQQFLEQATQLQKQGLDMKKQAQAEAAAAAAAAAPAASAAPQ